MGARKIRALLSLLPLALLLAWPSSAFAGGRVSRTSQRTLRFSANPAISVVPGFTATAVSTSAVQWSWSTGSFTGSGLTGYKLYTSSAAGAYIPLALDTSYYIDSGLGADSSVTRWVTVYDATDEGSDSLHIQKYTYALPPVEIAISSDAPVAAPTTNSLSLPWAKRYGTIVSTSAYAEIPKTYWFPNPVYASAYAIECSTDGGATYVRNRSFFVPWETFPVLSNKHYMIRMGALNGDDELTPGVYSATRTFTTPPLTPQSFAAVAVSSYTIEWRWDKDMFAGTGITGFKVYHSTIAVEGELPLAGDKGEMIATLGANTSYWLEVYIDSVTPSANSRHARWLKAVGYLESEGSQAYQKYTYAISAPTTTVVWPDPSPFDVAHLGENYISLTWDMVWTATGPQVGIASQFVIDHSTTGGFAVAVTSSIVGGPPQTISGLASNTRFDIRVGAINGDREQTPADAYNPFAYTRLYRVMTRPVAPSNYTCTSWTDTAMRCNWSTSAYTNPGYISGYTLGDLHHHPDGTAYWDPTDFLAGVSSTSYSLDYLMTNSTHTVTIWVTQQDPDWVAGNPHYDAVPKQWEYYYNHYGSYGTDADGYTYATPPNDVAFATIAPHGLGLQWLEPQVPATQYRVERSTTLGSKGPWVFVSSVTGNKFYDTGAGVSTDGLLPFTTYTYRIGAINLLGVQTVGLSTATAGHRADYSFAESTMTKHGAPTFFAVATGTTSIRWWWTEIYSGVTSYNLYTSTDGVLASGLAASATYYDEVGLSSANARYVRRVRSVTTYDGEGAYAEAAASTLVNAPASLAITSTGSYTLTLAWPASEGPRYAVARSTDGVNWSTVRSWSDVLVSTSFQDYGLRYATTYYYAVGAYNDDGMISLSSAVTYGVTLPLPSMYTAVFATDSAKNVTAPLPGPGLVTVTIPAGTPDGYFWISTSAATAPVDVSKNALDDATARLTDATLVPDNIVELHLFDVYGIASTATLPSAARVAITYPDADGDGIVDGTRVRVSTLRLYGLDTSALLWNQLPNSTLNAGTKTVYADVPHFSFYALGGDDLATAFKGIALSTTSLEWKWPLVAGVDGYYLYSSSTANKITLSSATSSYTDTGLGPNKPYTRWLTSYTGAAESAASQHIAKYTNAIPPDSFTLSTVTATSAYLEWRYSTATAYAVEGSTDGGASYYRIRDAFVPWQTVALMSNKSYRIRIGAVNGDNELSPGYYSTVLTATTPPLNMTMTGVAISSYTIEWRWDPASVAGTGITGFNVYRATSTEAGDPPAGETGEVMQSLAASATYWIEAFNGSDTANSLHSRWIKAVGLAESAGRTAYKRYTYAVAPSTCAPVFPEFKNVFRDSVNLTWNLTSASKYVIKYSTATALQTSADFGVWFSSSIVSGPTAVTGLRSNTKHDFKIGAINGDGLQTPDDAYNPYAYSALEKLLTRPPIPDVEVTAVTDTSLKWSWAKSTGTYASMDYISGYEIGIDSHTEEYGDFVLGIAYIPGTATAEYTLDYLITNSTHTRYIGPVQAAPATGYNVYGGITTPFTGATFATPPNDVSFDTITAHTIGLWWKEPQVPATQYRVERSTTMGEDGPWVFLSSVTGNHYLDSGLDISASGLATSTTYTYRIGAINQHGFQTLGLSTATNGNRRDYSFVESTMTVQIAPVLYAAAAGTGTINWSWTNSVPGVLSFNVYTSTNGILASGLSAAATYWTEVGLSSANAGYTRRIRSVTTMGESDYSEASAVTYALAPSALTSSATGLHTITLGWTGNGGTRYRLDRSADGVAWTTLKSWNDALTVSTYTDTGLRAAATYYYAAFAYNSDGVLSASSATSAGIRTDYLPADVTQVYSTATAALTVSAPLPGLGTLSVTIPAGAIAADDYISLSTSAATAPVEISSSDLTAATARMTLGSLLNGGVVELRRWDMYGALDTASFAVPARVKFAYLDANNDGIVDGTAVDVGTLRILLLDPATLEWVLQRNSVLDRAAKTVYLDTSHFSIYALASVISYAGPISKVFAYPNPYKPGSPGLFGQSSLGDGIVFESLPEASTIRIYDLAGGLVRELSDDDLDGRCFWDTRNKSGSRVASGVYIYLVKSPAGGKKSGKVVIIR